MKGFKTGVWVVVLGFALQTLAVEVTRPREGERFAVGETLAIRWTPGDSEEMIRIELRSTQERFVKVLAANVPVSRGGYNHSLRDIRPGDYRVVLQWGEMSVRSQPFVVYRSVTEDVVARRRSVPITRIPAMEAVVIGATQIAVTHPQKRQWIMDNQTVEVRWKLVGAMMDRVKIAAVIRKFGQAEKVFPIAANVPNSGAYTWNTSPMEHSPNDMFQIRVTTMDGNVTGLSEYFHLGSSAALAKARQDFLVLINQHRQANGKGALVLDNCLNKAAQGHSVYMYDSGNFSHTGKNGSGHLDRCLQAGCKCMAENIQMGADTAAQVFNAWKTSPGHNANMLGNFTHIGLGKAGSWWTTDFR